MASPWRSLALFHILPTLNLSGSVPQIWVPRAHLSRIPHSLQSGANSSVLPDNASILHVLRACMHAHTYIHTCTHTRSADACVLAGTPASHRTQALLPCRSRPVKPVHSCWRPWAPQPWQPCSWEPPRCSPRSQGSRVSWLARSLWLRRYLGPFRACPLEPRCPTPPTFLPPIPKLCPAPFPSSHAPEGAVLRSQTPLSLIPHQNTPPSESWCVRPRLSITKRVCGP